MTIKFTWLIFALMFFVLGCCNLYLSKLSIPLFKNLCKVKTINGLELGMDKFTTELNKYVNDQNKSNKLQNRLQAIGYFAASLTAIYSLLIC